MSQPCDVSEGEHGSWSLEAEAVRRKELGTQKLAAVFLLPGGGVVRAVVWLKRWLCFLKNMGLILSHYPLEVDPGPEKIGYPNRKAIFQASFLRGELLNFGGVGGTILR